MAHDRNTGDKKKSGGSRHSSNMNGHSSPRGDSLDDSRNAAGSERGSSHGGSSHSGDTREGSLGGSQVSPRDAGSHGRDTGNHSNVHPTVDSGRVASSTRSTEPMRDDEAIDRGEHLRGEQGRSGTMSTSPGVSSGSGGLGNTSGSAGGTGNMSGSRGGSGGSMGGSAGSAPTEGGSATR